MNPTIKKDFPILNIKINNHPLVYLDNAATTQKPKQVIKAITYYYEHHNSNVHRGIHHLSETSTELYEQSRNMVATFMGANSNQLIWTRNTTEAINLVSQTWAHSNLVEGDIIVTSALEHHSNLVPWQITAQKTGAGLTFVDITPDGQIDLHHLELLLESLNTQVKLIALTALSNTTGAVLDIHKVVRLIKKHSPNSKILLDGAQWVGRKKTTFSEWGIDFWAFSGHKMYGPMGIGGVLVKDSVVKDLEPWLVGGGMIDQVGLTGSTYTIIPERFDAGTPDVAGVVGLASACQYLQNIGLDHIESHEHSLTTYAIKKLSTNPHIRLIGPLSPDQKNRLGSVAFVHNRVHAHDVAQILDSCGVAVRSGHHCTMPYHKQIGYLATTRASFGVYNTTKDVDSLVSALHKVDDVFHTHK